MFLTYQILSDSTSKLQPERFNFIKDAGQCVGEYFLSKIKIAKSVDLQELVARLGLLCLDTIELHKFFQFPLCGGQA